MSLQTPLLWYGAVPHETRRLVLREPAFADVPRLALYAGDMDVARMLVAVPHPYTEAHGSAFVGDILTSNAAGDSLGLAIARQREPHAFIGMITFTLHGPVATIGWWLGKPYWGRGFATEAVIAMAGLAFRDPGIARLQAGAFEDNPASLRVHEKAGFVRTGVTKGASAARSGTVTQIEMELTREAFAALSPRAAGAKGRG